MRKILLGTTAVAGAALFAVSTAQAQEAPTVRVGGYIDFSYATINDNADVNRVTPAYPLNGNNANAVANRRLSSTDMRTDAEILVIVSGKAANGLSYGATIEMELDAVGQSASSAGTAGSGTTFSTDEMWMFVSSPTLGTLRFGDEDSAANLMQVRAPTLASNGPSGRWIEFMQGDGPARYLAASMNDGGDRTKVIYLSPQFAGFDFGISFAPNGGEGERERLGLGLNSSGTPNAGPAAMQRGLTTTQNEVTLAARYRGTLGGVGIAAGVAYTQSEAQAAGITSLARRHDGTLASGLQNPQAVSVGLNLSAFGFTIGGEYTTGKFSAGSGGGGAIGQSRDASTSFVVGGTYTVGALSLGAFYAGGKSDTSSVAVGANVNGNGATPIAARGDRTQAVVGLGAEYLIAPGLTGFASYASIQDKNLEAAVGNRAAGQSRNIDFFQVGLNLAF